MHQAWAFAHNVNLLAAGGSLPNKGYSGSGIYSGHHGALTSLISDVPVTRLLVANVPKIPETVLNKNLHYLESPKSNDYIKSNPTMFTAADYLPNIQLTMLDFNNNRTQSGAVCHNNFCCNYDIEVFVHKLPPNSVS